jgi:hypothetical protein
VAPRLFHVERRIAEIAFALAMVAAPRVAFACPVCFGRSDSPMAIATNMAIVFMLGITVAVLSAFGAFIIYLVRRANQFNDEGPEDLGKFSSLGTGPFGPTDPGDYVSGVRF